MKVTEKKNIEIDEKKNNVFKKMEDECSICLEPLDNKKKIIKLECCGNKYHKKCILNWQKHGTRCPLCTSILETNKKYCEPDECIIIPLIGVPLTTAVIVLLIVLL